MKLYTENVQNNQFHSACVYVLLIVTLESISLNYTVCIFGVCPRPVMDAYHPRSHLSVTCQEPPVMGDVGGGGTL